ncbi:MULTISPECIES: hypothetical protein [unclassified Burkholderia]|uniref:hypothetical protein n=1 Tax=unclassified Burkholderia TaxID=2613784 RepID=UPI000AE487E0|nr:MULTISPECIES: hypothetical protein [unclassified Burkholderia]
MDPIARSVPLRAAATIRGGSPLADILSIRRQIVEVACQQSLMPMRVEDRRNAAVQLNSWGRIRLRDDLTRVAVKISGREIPEPVKRNLVRLAGEALRNATVAGTSLELAAEIAQARAKGGARCSEVAWDHGIWPIYPETTGNVVSKAELFQAQLELQKGVIDGPAGERVARGESCKTVALEHGIWSESARLALERKAINTSGVKMALRGESAAAIAGELGICSIQARTELRDIVAFIYPVVRGGSIGGISQYF